MAIAATVVVVASLINFSNAHAELFVSGIADTPEKFAAFLREETTKWAKVAKQAGIKPE
jgi:tripartite-type tricarboxylate transporter receptor subunit TctC